MDGHPLYRSVEDLPELLSSKTDGPELMLPEVAPARIIEAVAARQSQGGRLQQKIDGCWCCFTVGDDGILCDPRSRANLRLRFALRWEGQRVDPRFVGWRIIGELEVGTTRAMRARDDRGEALGDQLDPFHVYELVAPDGRRVEGQELAWYLVQLVPQALAGRLVAVREALPGESWAAFAQDVFDRGGEGVVVRTPDGRIFRAKPQVDFDRAVRDVVVERDRRGHARVKLSLAVCTSAGARPRYRETQIVEAPAWCEKPRALRGLVVTIAGTSVDRVTGVVRFARVVAIREDKAPFECKLS